MSNEQVDRETGPGIRQPVGRVSAARVVLTANNYNIFEHLKIARTAGQLADILDTNFRATEILLDAVASLGLLAKQGKRYRITARPGSFC